MSDYITPERSKELLGMALEYDDQEINIKIAEACGWKLKSNGELLWHPPYYKEDEICSVFDLTELPDYCNDLNAMHDAEKTLEHPYYGVYLNNVENVVAFNAFPEPAPIMATARQRAEAFIKTIEQ